MPLPLALAENPWNLTPIEKEHLDQFLSQFPEPLFCQITEPKIKGQPSKVFHTKSLDYTNQSKNLATYIAVNGFGDSTKGRLATDCTSLQFAYIDLDAPKSITSSKGLEEYKQAKLKDLHEFEKVLKLSILVQTKRGFHVWYRLTPSTSTNLSSLAPEARSEAIKRYLHVLSLLRLSLNGDDGAADLTRVLRVPFSLHRKDPNQPFKCLLQVLRPEQSYTLEQMETAFIPLEQQLADKADKLSEQVAGLKPTNNKNLSEESEISVITNTAFRNAQVKYEIPKEVKDIFFEEAIQHLNKVYPIQDRPSYKAITALSGIPDGERNSTLIIAASLMRRAGIEQYDAESKLAGYNGLRDGEVRGVVRSAYRHAEPFEFAWNHPIFSSYVDHEERAKVRKIVSVYTTGKLSKYLELHREKQREKCEEARALDVVTGSTTFVPEEVPILSTKEQKDQLDVFPQLFLKDYPHLRFCIDGKYFLDLQQKNNQKPMWYVLSPDDIERLVMTSIEAQGLVKCATITTVKSQVLRISSRQEIHIKNEQINSDRLLKQDHDSNGPFVPVLNGIMDVEKKTIYPYSDRAIYLSPIQTPFLADADIDAEDRQIVKDFISSIALNNQERMDTLQKIAGYCLMSDNRFQKSFFFLGEGANGKSTYQNAISNMLGIQNTISFSFAELNKHFFLASIMNKRFGLVEEVSGNYFESDVFKRVTGESLITADRKNRDPISFFPFMKIIISMNQLPKVNDVADGYYRRITFVRFMAHFSSADGTADTNIEARLKKARAAFLHFAVQGLEMLLADNGFQQTPDDLSILNDYKIMNSSFLYYLTSGYESASPETSISFTNFYFDYRNRTKDSGLGVKSAPTLIAELQTFKHKDFPNFSLFGDPKIVYGIRAIDDGTTLMGLTQTKRY